MSSVELKVLGMSCMGCVKSVKGVLEGIDGVKSVEIDLKSGQTIIECEKPVEISVLKQAIDDAGFEVA